MRHLLRPTSTGVSPSCCLDVCDCCIPGDFEAITTEDDEPITTEADEVLTT